MIRTLVPEWHISVFYIGVMIKWSVNDQFVMWSFRLTASLVSKKQEHAISEWCKEKTASVAPLWFKPKEYEASQNLPPQLPCQHTGVACVELPHPPPPPPPPHTHTQANV